MNFVPGNSETGPEDILTGPTAADIEWMTATVDRARAAAEARQAERDQQDAARRAADDERRLTALTAELRALYLEVPGQTEADFQRALPRLLEDVARQTVNDRLSGTHGFRPESPLTRRQIVNS